MPKLSPDLEIELQCVDAVRSTLEHLAPAQGATAAAVRLHLTRALRASHPVVAAEIARREAEAAAAAQSPHIPE